MVNGEKMDTEEIPASKIRNFKDLKVWSLGLELVRSVYAATKKFPVDELYGITSQLRRSAVSIPSNIAEGFMRRHNKEFKQFLFIALSSSAELETQLIISHQLDYVVSDELEIMTNRIDRLNKMLMSLIKCL